MRKQDITFQDKLNELKLDLSHPNNSGIIFVLVEGGSDIRLFRKLFDLDNCKVENVPGGKFKLEECVNLLRENHPLIIGLRDADFLHLEDKAYSISNVFLTDLHDMEMILVSEDEVFSALIFEYTKISKDKHKEVRNNIITAIKQVGHLRLLNERENIEYNFEPTFRDLISFSKLDIDFKQYFLRILSKSPNSKIKDFKIIEEKIQVLNNAGFDKFQLTNGHDFIKALTQYLKESSDLTVGDDNISSSLRMSYTIEHFKKTKLFKDTKDWAHKMNCSLY